MCVRTEVVNDRAAVRLAAKAGASDSLINQAIRVRKIGISGVKRTVESDAVKLNMAANIVKLNPASQKRVIEASAQSRGEIFARGMRADGDRGV